MSTNNSLKYWFLVIFFCQIVTIYPLPLTYSTTFFDYGTIQINQPSQRSLTISNIYDLPQQINIISHSTVVTVSNNNFLLEPSESRTVNITFTGMTNILYQTAITLENQFHHTPDIITMTAQCSLPNNEYVTTYNLYDNQLKVALLDLISPHTSLGYDAARRTMYGTIDNINGFVECVYTGQQYTASSDIADMTAQRMDCEHTWPQSFGATGPARSDLHHLFPTNQNANNTRENYPFGIVTGTPSWSVGGSKKGTDSSGNIVFEPRDQHKGKVARAMIYFAIRYSNPSPPFFDNQEAVLKQWNRDFPVTTVETNRNNAIATFQGKKNPFIVHPPFADRIYSISTSATTPITHQLIYPSLVKYDTSGTVDIPIFNNGNADVTISSTTTNHQNITIQSYTSSILKKQIGHVVINVTQSNPNPVTVTMSTNAGTHTFQLQYNQPQSISEDVLVATIRPEIYPNPVRDVITVKTNAKKPQTNAEIYNIRGQKIYTEMYLTSPFKIDMPSTLPSGLYFLRLTTDRKVYNHKFIHIK